MWPIAAGAQRSPPVNGYLDTESSALFATRLDAFREGLNEIGFVEGQNVAIEYRWAEGNYDRLGPLAAASGHWAHCEYLVADRR